MNLRVLRMFNWLKKKLGILALEKVVTCQHQSIEAITLAVGKKRIAHFRERIVKRNPLRYDEIERLRKCRKKGNKGLSIYDK